MRGVSLAFMFVLFALVQGVAAEELPLVDRWGCPSVVKCQQHMIDNYGKQSIQVIGEIESESCFKAPMGCRPWHCEGNTTDGTYWMNRCNEKFKACRSDHHGYTDPTCYPHFPTL